MKRLAALIALLLALCLVLTGCGGNGGHGGDDGHGGYDNPDYGDEDTIKDPVIDWWKVYIDTAKNKCVTVQVSNPNNFPIQFSYDLVFYKDNQVVQTESFWAMTGLAPDKPGIIYGDYKMPSPSEVDDVRLENIQATKFEWRLIEGTFTETFIERGQQYFDIKFPEKPDSTEIWAVLYNDTNNDGKVQAEEFVAMGALAFFDSIYEQEGELTLPLPDDGFMYTDYQIYCLAFVR